MASSFDVALVTGLAQLLAADGVGVWREDGRYQDGEIGIVVGVLPQTPDRVISLMPYGVTDSPSQGDSVIGVQITTRWSGQDPREAMDLAGAVFDSLHGRTNTDLPTGVRVVQLLRQSWTPTGQDSNNRWRALQNFYADVNRPSTHRE